MTTTMAKKVNHLLDDHFVGGGCPNMFWKSKKNDGHSKMCSGLQNCFGTPTRCFGHPKQCVQLQTHIIAMHVDIDFLLCYRKKRLAQVLQDELSAWGLHTVRVLTMMTTRGR